MDFLAGRFVFWLVAGIGSLGLWMVTQAVSRLVFHPLAKFPGPKLAACSSWYEKYYDTVLSGQYTFKLKELHEKYGPVVRLNPDELHFNDPQYFDEVFNNSNGKTDKPYKVANVWGPYPAAIGTVDHDLHRIRRGAVNPFFSKRSVNDIMPFVNDVIEKLCARFEEASKTGESVNLKYCYGALTMDSMCEYCFSRTPDRVLEPDFGKQALDDIDGFVEASLVNLHFPWLMNAIYKIPEAILRQLLPAMAGTLDLRENLADQVESIRSGKDKSYEKSGHRTIFHSLLESNLPAQEKTRDRLRDEAFSLVSAGTETSSHVLKAVSYHIMANPDVHSKLVKELKTAIPGRTDRVELGQVEKLPYLTAVIREGLRLTRVVTHRFARVYPHTALHYRGYEIPPGTTVHMTSMMMHENEELFPDPFTFDPDRWLGDDSKRLQRYLTIFGLGTRACLGVNLAWAEMYVILATVFRRFEFDISNVVRERDVDCSRNVLLGAPSKDSKGIQVRVMRVLD